MASPSRQRGLVLLALFLSGLAGLMHEVVWAKLLANLTGSTAKSHAVVLSVFMGGLAIGAVLFGRRSDKRARPLLVYVLLEVAIGVYCLLLPFIARAAGALYETLAAASFESPGTKTVLRLGLSLAVITLPAILMGGTLPVLARYLIQEVAQTRKAVASLYALNNIGAVLGSGVAGFYLLPEYGIYGSLVAASAMNFIAAALVWLADRKSAFVPAQTTAELAAEHASLPVYTSSQFQATLWALALSGFAAMGYEVVFLRIIALGFGSSTYSFTVMLMCFITGIGIGSGIVSLVTIRRPLWWLAASQMGVIVSLIAVTPLLERMPYLISSMRTHLLEWPIDPTAIYAFGEVPHGFEWFLAGQAGYCFLMLLVPTICIGFGFPLVSQIQARSVSNIGGTVGSTYAWNTVGNVLGVVITSLLLLPALGMENALHANLALNFVAVLLLVTAAREAALPLRVATFAGMLALVVAYGAVGRDWSRILKQSEGHLRLRRPPPEHADYFLELAAGESHSVARLDYGVLRAWGDDSAGQLAVPPLDARLAPYVELDGGPRFNLARRQDGSLAAWGDDSSGQCRVPALDAARPFVQIAAGGTFGVALRADGTLAAWGSNGAVLEHLPEPAANARFTQLAAGEAFALALRDDGTIVAWGDDSSGQCRVPELPAGRKYRRITCGRAHAAALRDDGTLVAWGDDSAGQCRVPAPAGDAPAYIELSAGSQHTLALRADGKIVAWGDDSAGQCQVPAAVAGARCVEVRGGGAHSLARLSDGAVAAWGRNDRGQSSAPQLTEGTDPLLRSRNVATSFEWWQKKFVRDPARKADGWEEFLLEEDADTAVMGVRRERLAAIYINAKGDASTGHLDMITFLLSGHIPMFFLPDAKDVMVIGHGSGVTTGGIAQHPGVERLDVVEISSAVLKADRLFVQSNHGVLADPRTHVYLDDARTFLRTVPRKYDLIMSQPSNPWIAGIGSLFTDDFFRDCRERLKPGGIMMVWFHNYEQSDETIQLIQRTVSSVFPNVECFLSSSDVIALCTLEPLRIDFARMEERFDLPAVRQDLARVGIYNVATLLAYHGLSAAHFQALQGTGPLNTDDHQLLEYKGARNVFVGNSSLLLEQDPGFDTASDGTTDALLDRYIAWRREQGEPVSRLEMQVAYSSVQMMQTANHRLTRFVLSRALQTAPSAPVAKRPARGGLVPVAEMGFSEAINWGNFLNAQQQLGAPVALPYFERAVALEPTNSGAAIALANAYKQLGRGQDSVRELLRVIDAGVYSSQPQLVYAQYNQEQQRDADARTILEALVEREDNRKALLVLGEMAGQRAQNEEQLATLARAAQDTAALEQHTAAALAEYETAKQYWRRALAREWQPMWEATMDLSQVLRLEAARPGVALEEQLRILKEARSEVRYALYHAPGQATLQAEAALLNQLLEVLEPPR